MHTLRGGGKVVIDIDKRLPVQGGLGAASSNAVATMIALEHELGTQLGRRNGCASPQKSAAICRCS